MTTPATRIFDVPDISCDHCKHAIETEVGTVDGVTDVEVDVASKTVKVSGPATEKSVRQAIVDAGYEIAAIH